MPSMFAIAIRRANALARIKAHAGPIAAQLKLAFDPDSIKTAGKPSVVKELVLLDAVANLLDEAHKVIDPITWQPYEAPGPSTNATTGAPEPVAPAAPTAANVPLDDDDAPAEGEESSEMTPMLSQAEKKAKVDHKLGRRPKSR